MLGKLFKVIDNVKGLNVDEVMDPVYDVQEVKKAIIDGNRFQLAHGEDKDGRIIGKYRASRIEGKRFKTYTFEGYTVRKIKGEPFNFIDTTKFFTSFSTKKVKGGVEVVADDRKEDGTLTGRYGRDILGLGYESIFKVQKVVRPLFIDQTRKAIFK